MKFLKNSWFKVCILILISIGIYLNNSQILVPKNIKQISNISTDDGIFKKKQVCASYIEELKKIVSDKKIRNENDRTFLDEVFYSPTYDTCFYSFTTENSGDLGFSIVDYSTNKLVYFGNRINAGEFELKKIELKK